MWFPSRYREFGTVPHEQFTALCEAVLALDEEAWTSGDAIKQKLAGDRPTNSVFFWSLDSARYEEFVQKGQIEQEDVHFNDSTGLFNLVEPFIRLMLEKLEEDCIVSMTQLARMQPGAKINPHYDSNPVLIGSHRMHIPLITNDKLRFIVDDEQVVMKEGNLYELNNQLVHHVENPANAATRIHLIVDLLPTHFNNVGLTNQRLEFEVRKYQIGNAKPKPERHVKLPTVVATSVIRGANQSESHGGIYLVDLENERVEQKVDWDDIQIDFQGRGLDRGLRGVAFDKGRIFVASSTAIYEFDKRFNVVNKYENRYLKHAHEISKDGKYLYIASTGFDSVLRFDIKRERFDKGWSFYRGTHLTNFVQFDPNSAQPESPGETNRYHINNVYAHKGEVYISGRKMSNVICLDSGSCRSHIRTPPGTHNVQPLGKGFIYNDSEADRLVYSHKYDYRFFEVPRYPDEELTNTKHSDDRLARQAFGRGLCRYKEGIIIAGSSPSTITAYDFKSRRKIKSVNITKDVRNAIHGLEVWPF